MAGGTAKKTTLWLLVATFAGLGSAMDYCEGWRSKPRTCSCYRQFEKSVLIHCESMESFADVVERLKIAEFGGDKQVTLEIDGSKLEDLHRRLFKELNMTIVNLKLNNSGLRHLNPESFSGLKDVQLFSLADNPIEHVPTMVLRQMPNIETLDLGRMKIQALRENSFNNVGNVQALLLATNLIKEIDTNSIPAKVTRLHLGRNKIRHLNGTLTHLNELIWLFINDNYLTSLDNQLPVNGSKMCLLHASRNHIEKLPHDLRHLPKLSSLFMNSNKITTLDGILSKSSELERLQLEHNHIKILQKDDFTGAVKLQSLHLDYNHLTSLNGSMHPLTNLGFLNLSHNWLPEFSFEEIKGLDKLTILDLSHNHIRHLVGFTVNSLEWGSNLSELRLHHNDIHRLNCAVSGFTKLIRLDVSFNKIAHISPEDFIGLENLFMLDISHNRLTTLEETSKTYLPLLVELLASHNRLHKLDKDFHGLPVLCWADLSYNQITTIGRDLVTKTHCRSSSQMHTHDWQDLDLTLTGNPIMCDISYPDLKIDMERNHTKLTGEADCVSYSNMNYLSFTTEPTLSPSLDHKRIESPYLDPIYNIGYNPVTDMSNQVKKSIETSVEEQNNHQNQIPSQEVQDQLFVPLQEPEQNNEMQPPIPYQYQNYFDTQEKSMNANQNRLETTINMSNKNLNAQHVYAHVDPQVQQSQLTQLATEIEQLRAKVEELASENQRLVQNLSQQTVETSNANLFEDTRPASSTGEPPNERTP